MLDSRTYRRSVFKKLHTGRVRVVKTTNHYYTSNFYSTSKWYIKQQFFVNITFNEICSVNEVMCGVEMFKKAFQKRITVCKNNRQCPSFFTRWIRIMPKCQKPTKTLSPVKYLSILFSHSLKTFTPEPSIASFRTVTLKWKQDTLWLSRLLLCEW